MTAVAIMQPTYLPWIGYFALMDRVDTFVLLDTVQFARRSWQQRNRIKSAAGEQMLTVPTRNKGRRHQGIREVEIEPSTRFAVQHCRAIEHAYAKAPYFSTYAPQLFEILQAGHPTLAELTVALIRWLCARIGVETPLIMASALAPSGQKADLLADLCRQIGASAYVAPPGSRGYLDESSAFDDAGIALHYHDYDHPRYPQLYGEFLPYMAAIDLAFNVGADSLEILRSGVRR